MLPLVTNYEVLILFVAVLDFVFIYNLFLREK